MSFLRQSSLRLASQCRYIHVHLTTKDLRPRVATVGAKVGATPWRRITVVNGRWYQQNRYASNINSRTTKEDQDHGSSKSGSGSDSSSSPSPASVSEPIDVPATLWYHRLGPVTQFFTWFHRTQGKRPLTIQLAMTLLTYLCGDLLAQEIGGEAYDPWRTLRMLTIGAIVSVPGYKWFIWLGNHFNYPSSRWGSILVKTCVQQAIFTPVFNTYFFGMQAILTGESPSGVIERVKATVPVSMWNSLKLWPAVTAFSFAFIAPPYRFMFSGVFAVCWQAYLSFLNRAEEKLEHAGINVACRLKEINEVPLSPPSPSPSPSGQGRA